MDRLARRALMARIAQSARRCAAMLDECGSESEFRLKCAAKNLDPETVFKPYGQYVELACAMDALGLRTGRFRLSDWWAFENIPGANKPDPWLSNMCDKLR